MDIMANLKKEKYQKPNSQHKLKALVDKLKEVLDLNV